MSISVNSMEGLFRYGHLLTHIILVYTDKRIGDWLTSGGALKMDI